jgi:hypothetical protein
MRALVPNLLGQWRHYLPVDVDAEEKKYTGEEEDVWEELEDNIKLDIT